MRVRVLSFARVRELLDTTELTLELDEGARVENLWQRLEGDAPALRELRASTRVARNGRIVGPDERLADGDELALLPPVGGG